VGAGLIGSLLGVHLLQKGYKVLVIDKDISKSKDTRTLAVNANSKDFLIDLGLWKKLKNKPQKINKIVIKDYINKEPLIFENKDEEMGNVIFNNELLSITRQALKTNKSLLEIPTFNLNYFHSNQVIRFNNQKYFFEHIVLSVGKKFDNDILIKKYSLNSKHHAFVGFFKHAYSHNQIAYETFTPNGPLAVLPSPDKNNKTSTFIYSTKDNLSNSSIIKIIKKNFTITHGKIRFEDAISQFPISPHISRDKLNQFILIGDTLRSIHPVAGQGWNLGIKDIQTFGELLENYGLKDDALITKYSRKRALESFGYLSFTSLINIMYESRNPLAGLAIKFSHNTLKNISFLRKTFIRQAMGRLKLI
jgi:2-octaprenyl-6-methoxyphenol hydroxylase